MGWVIPRAASYKILGRDSSIDEDEDTEAQRR